MSVRNHRILAAAIWVVGLIAVLSWGRSMVAESPTVNLTRGRFDGDWVATSVTEGERRSVEGDQAATTTAHFEGKSVEFHHLVGGIDAAGTYYIEDAHPGWIDFKLDAGWIIGFYELDDATLKVCLNSFAPPERLGIPTLARPRRVAPGEHRQVYLFRRAGNRR